MLRRSAPRNDRKGRNTKVSPIERRIVFALAYSGFSSIGIALEGGKLTIDLQNNKYFYSSRAVTVALEAIAPLVRDNNAAGNRIDQITLIMKENGLPLYSYRTMVDDLLEYAAEKLSYGEFYSLGTTDTGYTSLP